MISADLIIVELKATSKRQAFQAIAGETAPLFRGSPEILLTALLDRERIGSTGIGCGVAIPHIRLEKIDRMYSVLAKLEKPVDYDAVDGQPVDIIFTLLAPAADKTTLHLKALAQISRLLRDPSTCGALRAADDRDKIIRVLEN